MRAYLISAVFFLTACTPQQEVTRRFDNWTGFAEIVTEEYEILRNATAIMTVRGVVIEREGQRAFAVFTSIRRLAPNGPILRAMYSGNTRLNYVRHDRLWTQCTDRCRPTETGAIQMTETAFRMASKTGLRLRVSGRRGRYEATIPAGLFQTALNAV